MIIQIGNTKRYLIFERDNKISWITNLNNLKGDFDNMSKQQEFSNRDMEVRDPRKLVVITKAMLDQYPEHRQILEQYYDKRGDRVLDPLFAETVREAEAVIDPIKITHVDTLDADVVLDGRQRRNAAVAVGLQEVPVIVYSDEAEVRILLELTSNLARSENTPVESAHAFRKAMLQGKNQEDIARMCGITGAQVTHILSLGDMPPIVHEWINKGKLTPTAALTLKKAVGKPAPKGSGLTAIYDAKEVKAHLEGLENAARQAGGAKIKVAQAKNSKSNHADRMTNKDWKAVIADSETPSDYATLIAAVLGDISPAQARQQGLLFVKKTVPQPKPKKVKEPKVKGEKAKTKDVGQTDTPQTTAADDVKSLFV